MQTKNRDVEVERLRENVKAQLKSEFVLECFCDWLDDMMETDWSYYGAEPEHWKQELLSHEEGGIVEKLNLFGSIMEDGAYQSGYLPNAAGTDVRTWSQYLTPIILD